MTSGLSESKASCIAARVEEIFDWGVCRVSYRIPEGKEMMKSLRIEDVEPWYSADELENRSAESRRLFARFAPLFDHEQAHR